nr:unnamed protein product [Callosobruchus analis]
MEYLHFC